MRHLYTSKVVIGAACLITAAGLYSCSMPKEESIERKVENAIVLMEKNPELVRRNYEKLSLMLDRPEYANQNIKRGLMQIEKGKARLNDDNKERMFFYFKVSFEDRPELVDRLGENAQQYIRHKYSCEEELKRKVRQGIDYVVEKGAPILDEIKKTGDYIFDKSTKEGGK